MSIACCATGQIWPVFLGGCVSLCRNERSSNDHVRTATVAHSCTRCYHVAMSKASRPRVFKTAWFAKAAKKARIADVELCEAIRQVLQNQADDLGGGVFKKRLNANMHRSIILAKAGNYWIYEYLFAKKDRENIDNDELIAFRKLAKIYAKLADKQIAQLLENKDLLEICHASQEEI